MYDSVYTHHCSILSIYDSGIYPEPHPFLPHHLPNHPEPRPLPPPPSGEAYGYGYFVHMLTSHDCWTQVEQLKLGHHSNDLVLRFALTTM